MFPQVRQPGNRQPARRTNGVAFLSCLRVFVVNGWLTVSARTRALRHTARLRQNPESFSLLPVVLLFSVSTSGPGAAAPGSQRKKHSRLRGEKFTSNLSHYAPKHRNFHAKFFQKFCQLLSEQRHLCVNNPREVERERSQTGLPGQQPPPRATCPDPRRPGPVETDQPTR